jgi:branched-chain amino acid transport system permease protein
LESLEDPYSKKARKAVIMIEPLGKKTFTLSIIIILVVFPFLIGGYWLHLLMEILILCLFATSLNIVLGYGGMISFGHAGFYGLGLYFTAGLLKNTSLPLPMIIIIAALVSSVAAFIIGFFCVRLRAFYFAILTLAFGQLIWAIIYKWRNLTGGEDGIIGLSIPGYLTQQSHLYFFVLGICVICIGLIYILINSPFGKILISIRENQDRTECIGVNVNFHRLIAFVISGFFCGIAGALYSLVAGGAFPDLVAWGKSGEVLLSCVLGGMYTFWGPALGSLAMIVLESTVTSLFVERWPIILGSIFILVALGLPNGLLGTLLERKNRNE